MCSHCAGSGGLTLPPYRLTDRLSACPPDHQSAIVSRRTPDAARLLQVAGRRPNSA